MDKISIVLEAVERAKGVLNQTLADIAKLDAQNKKTETTWQRLNAVVQEHDKILLGLKVTMAAVLATSALLLHQAVETADQYLKLAAAAGTTVETFSTLAFAAKQSSVDVQALSVGLKGVQISAVAASQGSADQAAAYAALGISVRDAAGHIKDSVTLTLEVADAFRKSEDGSVKAAIAQRIFGRSSQEFVLFLNQGSKAIEEQQQQAKALGLEISTKTAQAANQFGDNILALKGILQGMANVIVAQLLPALIEVQNFFLQNPGYVRTLAAALVGLSGAIVGATIAWRAFVIAGNLAAATLGVGAVKNARDYLAAIQLIAATPFVAYTAGIAGAVAIIYAGVEAWKAYKAAQEEATTHDNLAAQQARFDNYLVKQIDSLKAAGKITVLEADRMKKALSEAFLGGNDRQLGEAQKLVGNKIRAAKGLPPIGTTPTDKPEAKQTLVLPDPALQKAQSDASGAITKAALDAEQANFADAQRAQQTILDDSLRRRVISLDDFRAQQRALDEAATAEAIKLETDRFDAEKASLEKSKGLTVDPKEQATLDGQIRALEITHEQALTSIHAANTQQRFATDQKYYDGLKALVTERVAQANNAEAAAAADFQSKLDELSSGGVGTQTASLSAADDLNAIKDEYIGKLSQEHDALIGILATMQEINAQQPGTFNEADTTSVQKQIAQNEKAQVDSQKRVSEQKLRIQTDELGATASLLGSAAEVAKSFGKKGFAVYKALAIAQAVVSGAAAVLLQLGGGDPYSAPFRAAAAAAVAAVQIGTIIASQPSGYAGGGLITGPGGGTDDRVTIQASNHEFMVRNAVVEQPGALAFLHDFNNLGMSAIDGHMVSAGRSSRFADGGLIGDAIQASTAQRGTNNLKVGFIDTRNQMRRWMQEEGVGIALDGFGEHGNQVVS